MRSILRASASTVLGSANTVASAPAPTQLPTGGSAGDTRTLGRQCGVEPLALAPRRLANRAVALVEVADGVLVHATGINAQRDLAAVRRLIERGVPVDTSELADAGKPLAAASVCERLGLPPPAERIGVRAGKTATFNHRVGVRGSLLVHYRDDPARRVDPFCFGDGCGNDSLCPFDR